MVSEKIKNVLSKIKRLDHRRLQMVIALVIVAIGLLGSFILVKFRRPPKRVQPTVLAPLVKVQKLHVRDIEMVVSGFGTVSPKVEVEIVPQVSGKIVAVHPQFKTGGVIPAGEVLIEIDPRDYELALQQGQAAVAEAQVRLDVEKAEGRIALDEWEQLNPGTEPTSPLVLHEPQIRQAQARLESALATLETAKLGLERTKLLLPLDVRIMTESADLGQYIMIGRTLGSAYALEAVEIELPLEDSELAWFDIPEGKGSLKGTSAEIKAEFASAEHKWDGYVVRTTGQVDQTSRLVSVVIEVSNPFDTSGGKAALLPGMFVEVSIRGRKLKSAVAVPRDAVRSGNEVWVVSNNKIHIQSLEIVRKDEKFIYVTGGLEDGAEIVTSSLDVVTEGMEVRTEDR